MKKELKIILEGINQWEQGTRIRPMREQNRYVMIKQLIPGLKITQFWVMDNSSSKSSPMETVGEDLLSPESL